MTPVKEGGTRADIERVSELTAASACAYHPDRETDLACGRCRRPVCPDCVVRFGEGMLCLSCLDEHYGNPSTAPPAGRSRPRLDLAALRAKLPGRAFTDDERLHRPGLVFYLLVAAFLGLCVAAAFSTIAGEITLGQRTIGVLLVVTGWIVSLCFHEYAHAYVAYRWGGDHEVAGKGYLTLDPRKYSDPVNSVAFPIACLILGGVGLPGGAVFVNRERVHSRRVLVAISLAGPAMNLAFALVLIGIVRTGLLDSAGFLPAALAFLAALELATMFLNLLPVPGLDGYHAIEPYLPRDLQFTIARLGMIPMIVLFVLIFATDAFDFLWTWTFWCMDHLGVDPLLTLLGFDVGSPDIVH